MGEVYRARDARLGRDVAIKVLPGELSRDPARLRRFEQEARAASSINHANILTVYDVGSDTCGPYIVFELLEGSTLRALLASGGLPFEKAVDYAAQIARGLAAAHEKMIVHRDLKPENLFITHDEIAKILDFGLAKLAAHEGLRAENLEAATLSRGTEAGAVLGTVGYMSPEQVRGQPTDASSDIFSFGAILYELLSGSHGRGLERDPQRRAAQLLHGGGARPTGPRPCGQAMPGEKPGPALPVRPGVGVCAPVVVGRVGASRRRQR
jgi:serine/threonine protein kinase